MALVHRWKFENDLNDSVGSSNGSNTNCTFYPNNINGNYSIYIPKTPTGYPTFPNINISSYANFTWAFWFRSVISGVQQYLVMDWTYPGAPDERLSLVLQDNNRLLILPYVGGKFWYIYSTTNLNVAAWNHVVLTASGTGSTYFTLYLNGKYENSGTQPRSTYNTNTFRLGVHSPGVTAAKFDGYMDDFRFYDTALTADEVMNLYKSYNTPIWQQPLHRWKLDGDATDSAGSTNGVPVNIAYDKGTKVFNNYSAYFSGPVNEGGSISYVKCDYIDISSYANFTMAFWMRCTNTVAGYPIVCGLYNTETADRFYVYHSNGSIAIVTLTPSPTTWNTYSAIKSYPINNWHFVVFTNSGSHTGTGTIYVNGAYDTSFTCHRPEVALNKFTIGTSRMFATDPDVGVSPFKGYLQDVRFYDVALSAADVRALYNSYFTEKATNFMSML